MPHLIICVLVSLFCFFTMSPSMVVAEGTTDGSSEAEGGYGEAKARIAAGDFAGAVAILGPMTVDQPENADAFNLLGFSNRKMGNLEAAAVAYKTALTINPSHLGALEYQGEMFVEMGELAMAQANLDKLQSLCGACEQAQDLKKALAG